MAAQSDHHRTFSDRRAGDGPGTRIPPGAKSRCDEYRVTTVVIDRGGGSMSVAARRGGTRRGRWRAILPVTVALFVVGCGGSTGSARPSEGASSSEAASRPPATLPASPSDSASASAEAGLPYL